MCEPCQHNSINNTQTIQQLQQSNSLNHHVRAPGGMIGSIGATVLRGRFSSPRWHACIPSCSNYADPVPLNMDKKQTKVGNMIDWLGDNANQVDAGGMEKHFKTAFPILLGDENVELAFKSGRDSKCFTNRRVLLVDVKGLTGKKIEFLTIPTAQSMHSTWLPLELSLTEIRNCGFTRIRLAHFTIWTKIL